MERVVCGGTDVFNAIAEPQRRRLLGQLKRGEKAVNDVTTALGMTQPQVSKHLRVLRELGLVRVRDQGRQRLNRLDARGLREVHEWTGGFEAFRSGSFDRLQDYVRELQQEDRPGRRRATRPAHRHKSPMETTDGAKN